MSRGMIILDGHSIHGGGGTDGFGAYLFVGARFWRIP